MIDQLLDLRCETTALKQHLRLWVWEIGWKDNKYS